MKVTNLITPDVLAGIDDINRKCHAMHLPSPPVQFFNAEVSDADGTVVEVLKSKSNSWVRNAYNFLAQSFLPCDSNQGSATFGEGSQALKDTGGTTRRSSGYPISSDTHQTEDIFNSAADVTSGIVVGTGDTAESFESHALATLVAHGSGSGQLIYSVGTNPTASYDAESKKWTVPFTRTFTNSSGSAITVKEIGIIFSCKVSTTFSFLMSRDVLATPITVANGQTLTITYTSEITYPA